MFWETLFGFVIVYMAGGISCLTTLTRDEYRRMKLKFPDKSESELRSDAASQGWGNSIFWPVFMLMHISERALDRDAKVEQIDERTKQILGELRDPTGWQQEFNNTEKSVHEKKFLAGEGK
jgi:hypothetical protein